MILADTSAWVEFIRGTGSSTDHRIADLVIDPEVLAVTEPVIMEVSAIQLVRAKANFNIGMSAPTPPVRLDVATGLTTPTGVTITDSADAASAAATPDGTLISSGHLVYWLD